jgi:hypothetical protein
VLIYSCIGSKFLKLKKGMMDVRYSFTCPTPCNYKIIVDARNGDEAIAKVIEKRAIHRKQVDDKAAEIPMGQLKSMVRLGMAKAQATTRSLVGAVLALWFVLVFFLGEQGAFVRSQEAPPIPILLGVTVPLVVFLAAYLGSKAFRALVLGADLRVLTAVQAWRAGGLSFLALYAHDVLPGLFAWPAGLGDIFIGVTAPWVMLALIRQPGFMASRLFLAWNLLGILDLVVAVGTGVLSSGFVAGLAGAITTAPMAELPLVLIPVYFVPLFIMLHLAALFQGRHSPASGHSGEGS